MVLWNLIFIDAYLYSMFINRLKKNKNQNILQTYLKTKKKNLLKLNPNSHSKKFL